MSGFQPSKMMFVSIPNAIALGWDIEGFQPFLAINIVLLLNRRTYSVEKKYEDLRGDQLFLSVMAGLRDNVDG